MGTDKTNAVKRKGSDSEVVITSTVSLKRDIGLVSATAYVVGTIIGSGIFISPQGVLRNTGSVGLCLTLWASGAVISLLGALTFTELVSIIRKSGSEYAILKRTIGSIPAFVFVWTGEIARNPASRAVQTLAFAEYLSAFMQMCGSPVLPKRLIAIIVLIFLAMTNSYSVTLTSKIQIIFTITKLASLAIIMVGGLVMISKGTVSDLGTGFEGSITAPGNIALAFYSVSFAYGGWNNVNNVIEEVKNPRRNGPFASIFGIVLVAVVYMLTNISYLAVMTRQELLASTAVAKTWGDRVLGPASWLIPFSVMMSVFGSANGGIGTNSRVQFAAARDGNWWGFISFISVKRLTPMPSIFLHVGISIFMVLQGSITSLMTFLSFSSWVFYGLCGVCCIILRFTEKDCPDRIKIPIFVPVLLVLVSTFLVMAPIIQNPRIEILYAAAFIVGGGILYFPLIRLNFRPKILVKFEMYLQLLLEVSPSYYQEEK